MAAPEVLNFDELAVRWLKLQRRHSELERRLVRLRERHGRFPNDVSGRQLAELNTERGQVHEEIKAIRDQLLPVMRAAH